VIRDTPLDTNPFARKAQEAIAPQGADLPSVRNAITYGLLAVAHELAQARMKEQQP
jgi:hypothetical protein